MQKERIAFYTGDKEACIKVYVHLNKLGEKFFTTTKKWIKSGLSKYKYVIFNGDNWEGYNSLDLLEFTNKGSFTIKLEEVRL